MSSRRRRSSASIARDSLELGLAAPEVIARRMTQFWLAGSRPSRRDQLEFYRMSAEKVAAFQESWNAMFLELCRANFELGLAFMGWPWSAASRDASARLSAQSQKALTAILGAGLAPVRRRAVGNVKRLRRAPPRKLRW